MTVIMTGPVATDDNNNDSHNNNNNNIVEGSSRRFATELLANRDWHKSVQLEVKERTAQAELEDAQQPNLPGECT